MKELIDWVCREINKLLDDISIGLLLLLLLVCRIFLISCTILGLAHLENAMNVFDSYIYLTLNCKKNGDEVKAKLKEKLPPCKYTRLHVMEGDVLIETFSNVHEPDYEFNLSAEHVRLMKAEEAGLMLKVCGDNDGVEVDFVRSGPDMIKQEDTFEIRLLKL